MLEPRKWQNQALLAWKASLRGIVAAVTGAGKTTFALLCIDEYLKQFPNGHILIVVPTIPLLDQWFVALVDDYGVAEREIGFAATGRKNWEESRYVVAVINSAREIAPILASKHPTFLIVDECHRAGSKHNSKIFTGRYDATLGLSATPERQFDDGFEQLIKPALGEIVFTYSYNQAFDDGVIVPFRLVNVEFSLTSEEMKEYDKLTRRIAILARQNDEEKEDRIKTLLRRRARVSWNSPLRVPLAAKLALKHRSQRMIIFHETVSRANEIHAILVERGLRATIYHTHLSPVVRRQNLRLYKSGYYSCIVCCRALDEGLNVPNTSIAIIASSTSSTRQRIQRLGRVLRKILEKSEALVYTLYATKIEKDRLRTESDRLEGVSEVSWLNARVKTNG